MKKIFLVTFLLLIGVSTTFAQKELTLDEAISIALQRNSGLLKSANAIEGNKAQVKSAYGNLLPNLSAGTGWGWNKSEGKDRIYIDPVTFETKIISGTTTSDSYSLRAGGGITLFDGLANYANISQSEDRLEAARENFSKLKQDIIYQTTDLFYAVLNAKEILSVREENVKFNEKFLERIQERNRLGSVPIADVLRQQVQFGNAELQYIQSQNAYENAKSTFLNFLALDVLEDYDLINPRTESEMMETEFPEQANLYVLIEEALANRSDYRGQMLSLSAAESGVTIARGGLFPTISGNFGFSTGSNSSFRDLFERKEWNVGLSLNIPIFSNWNTETQIQAAKIQEFNAQEDLSALERQIKIEVKQVYLDFIAAKKSLEVTTKNVISAEENRKISQERYNLGSSTILDVLQADKDYIQAVSDKLNAQFTYYKLQDKMKNVLGKLDYKKFE